jgi:hypothetical protein
MLRLGILVDSVAPPDACVHVNQVSAHPITAHVLTQESFSAEHLRIACIFDFAALRVIHQKDAGKRRGLNGYCRLTRIDNRRTNRSFAREKRIASISLICDIRWALKLAQRATKIRPDNLYPLEVRSRSAANTGTILNMKPNSRDQVLPFYVSNSRTRYCLVCVAHEAAGWKRVCHPDVAESPVRPPITFCRISEVCHDGLEICPTAIGIVITDGTRGRNTDAKSFWGVIVMV